MEAARTKPRRTTLRRALILAVAVTAIGTGVWFLARPTPVAVKLAVVERGLVEATVANTRAGTVKAPRRAHLAPSAGGQVAKLGVREGERVKQGMTLLELWNVDLAAQVSLAESQAQAARAKAEESCLLADQAMRDFNRQKKLYDDGIASVDKVEAAQSNAEALEASCEAARAVAKESAAGVAVARAALEKTILVAPFDGVVAKLNVELGEYVTPSPPGIPTPPAVDLIEIGKLYVEAPIDEVDAPKVRPGLPARVTLDAFAGRTFPGRVRRVAPYVLDAEKQARTVDIEVELEREMEAATDGQTTLLPGYSADVELLIRSRPDVLRVPTETILEGERVMVYRDGRLAARTISIGVSNWEFTEVTSGLEAGERIVLSISRDGVRDGARAVPEKSTRDVEER